MASVRRSRVVELETLDTGERLGIRRRPVEKEALSSRVLLGWASLLDRQSNSCRVGLWQGRGMADSRSLAVRHRVGERSAVVCRAGRVAGVRYAPVLPLRGAGHIRLGCRDGRAAVARSGIQSNPL